MSIFALQPASLKLQQLCFFLLQDQHINVPTASECNRKASVFKRISNFILVKKKNFFLSISTNFLCVYAIFYLRCWVFCFMYFILTLCEMDVVGTGFELRTDEKKTSAARKPLARAEKLLKVEFLYAKEPLKVGPSQKSSWIVREELWIRQRENVKKQTSFMRMRELQQSVFLLCSSISHTESHRDDNESLIYNIFSIKLHSQRRMTKNKLADNAEKFHFTYHSARMHALKVASFVHLFAAQIHFQGWLKNLITNGSFI